MTPLGAVSWDFYLAATHKDQTCHRCAWCCPHTTHAPRSEGMDVVLNSETRAQELRFVKHLSFGSFGLVSLVEHKQTKKCFAKPSAMIWDIYGLKRSLQVMEVGMNWGASWWQERSAPPVDNSEGSFPPPPRPPPAEQSTSDGGWNQCQPTGKV